MQKISKKGVDIREPRCYISKAVADKAGISRNGRQQNGTKLQQNYNKADNFLEDKLAMLDKKVDE